MELLLKGTYEGEVPEIITITATMKLENVPTKKEVIDAMGLIRLGIFLKEIKKNPENYPTSSVEWCKWLREPGCNPEEKQEISFVTEVETCFNEFWITITCNEIDMTRLKSLVIGMNNSAVSCSLLYKENNIEMRDISEFVKIISPKKNTQVS